MIRPSVVAACVFLAPFLAYAQGAPTPAELPAVITSIRIETTHILWSTEKAIIRRELPWKEGDRVTPEQWDLGIARLWNTGLFSQIDALLVHDETGYVAVIKLEERLTLNPLLKFALEGGTPAEPPTWWFHVGVSDPNLFGKFIEVGILYEMFGSNPGGDVWFHNPRLFGKRLDGWFQVSYLPRPRPGFLLFRGTARAQVSYEINDSLVVLGRLDGILDRFGPPPPGTGPTDEPIKSEGLHASASIRFGRVDTIRLLLRGWSLELQPLYGITNDPTHPQFWQGWGQALAYIPLANRWNFAFRLQGGITTPAPAQDLWYIEGLDHVRGLPDNAITTTAYGLANAEVRVVVFDSEWIALVPAAFVDAALASPYGTPSSQTALSVGAGIRILVPKFVTTGLRFDGAYVVGAPISQQSWYSIGVYQFF